MYVSKVDINFFGDLNFKFFDFFLISSLVILRVLIRL